MPPCESASAPARPTDVEDSIPTPSTGHSQPAPLTYDPMVDDGLNVGQNYNNSELNQPSRWSQQDLAFDLMFDPFVFWGSEETPGMLTNPLSNGNFGITTPTVNHDIHLSPGGHAIQGESSRQNREAETAQVIDVHQAKGPEIQILRLADLPSNDRDILVSEQYYHVPRISESIYNNIYTHYVQQCDVSHLQAFPDAEVLNTFMQLYFEFCHRELPIFHLSTFDPSPDSWILVVAIIAAGCNYSMCQYRREVSEAMLALLHRAISQKIADNNHTNGDLPLAQGIFLFNLCQLFHGARGEFLKLQYQRNILITLCRLHMAQASSMFNMEVSPDAEGHHDAWQVWIREESWRRLTYATWMLECFQWMLFDTQPILASWELRLSLPCREDLWKCASKSQWADLASIPETLSEPSLATIMSTPSALTGSIRSLGSYASLILILSFSAEEKRQRLCHGYDVYHLVSNSYLKAQSDLLGDDSGSHLQSSGLAPLRQKLFLALSILHRVHLRMLYRACGWMTSSKDREAAKQELFAQLSNDRSTARCTLRHAACLFRLIRTQRKMTFCDPQMFLIATLYIWYHIDFERAGSERFQSHQDSSSCSSGGNTREGLLDRPLRIDQEEMGDEDTLEEWITNGDQRRHSLHITGVGILQEKDSWIRLLQESLRVLRHENAWARMGRGISQALEMILESGTTSFDGKNPRQGTDR
ncbi:fungal-specific transcription factor domain-containing protein [Aspergillus pseudodeflectus]|uniref:Fungal-specific transcription factor domain-containing protein n=1 Tax=Aspergillus pseudodeflectus TaxID=176178 RepID=A0ABR4JBZ6_9EURO